MIVAIEVPENYTASTADVADLDAIIGQLVRFGTYGRVTCRYCGQAVKPNKHIAACPLQLAVDLQKRLAEAAHPALP